MICGARLAPKAAAAPGPAPSATATAAPAASPHPSDDEPTDPAMPTADPTLIAGVELRMCEHCGAANAARRRRCARCDASLVPGAGPSPAPAPLEVRPPPEPAPPLRPVVPPKRRRGLTAAVIVLGILLGGGVGLLAGLGRGPFAGDGLALPEFVAAEYPGDPDDLLPATAGASATLEPTGARTFGPELTADTRLDTAWVGALDATDIRLQHTFDVPVWVFEIRVANGDQSGLAFDDRARLHRVEIDFGRGQRVRVTLRDEQGEQLIRLPTPVITDQATWHVREVFGEGPVAVSEVAYVGYPATDADADEFDDR
jgi:hypothetical protein